MGKMTIKCNSEQLKYIQKDFEDASVPVDMSYGPFIKANLRLIFSTMTLKTEL